MGKTAFKKGEHNIPECQENQQEPKIQVFSLFEKPKQPSENVIISAQANQAKHRNEYQKPKPSHGVPLT